MVPGVLGRQEHAMETPQELDSPFAIVTTQHHLEMATNATENQLGMKMMVSLDIEVHTIASEKRSTK